MKLGDIFPDTYFDGSATLKKDFVKELLSPFSSSSSTSSPCASDPSLLINSARTSMDLIIDKSSISSFSKDFCKACFASAPDEFFILPTSTTGKYHGGRANLANCVGGNICHTSEVLGMVPKVLNRYNRLVDKSSVELLRISCILHDICKISSGEVYTNNNHGELGAELINRVWKNFDKSNCTISPTNLESISFAVANHMYLWRFYDVFSQLRMEDSPISTIPFIDLLIGLMLAECDYYSF